MLLYISPRVTPRCDKEAMLERLAQTLPPMRALALRSAARGWSSAAAAAFTLAARQPVTPALLCRRAGAGALPLLRAPPALGSRVLGCPSTSTRLLLSPAAVRLPALLGMLRAERCSNRAALAGAVHAERGAHALEPGAQRVGAARRRGAHSYPVPSKKKLAGKTKIKMKTCAAPFLFLSEREKGLRYGERRWGQRWQGGGGTEGGRGGLGLGVA